MVLPNSHDASSFLQREIQKIISSLIKTYCFSEHFCFFVTIPSNIAVYTRLFIQERHLIFSQCAIRQSQASWPDSVYFPQSTTSSYFLSLSSCEKTKNVSVLCYKIFVEMIISNLLITFEISFLFSKIFTISIQEIMKNVIVLLFQLFCFYYI